MTINNLKKNYMYNALYNILILITPLVTTPYISRIMGAEMIGRYSYSFSIASYFGLFILLGLNNYGNREIASVTDDKEKLSQVFCSIYMMQLLMAMFVIIIYTFYIVFLSSDQLLAYIQLIYLFAVTIDINWFFFGIEQFKLTATRSIIIKLLSICCMFLFVKCKSDIYIYAIIMVATLLFSQLLLWCFIRQHVVLKKVKLSEAMQHIKPNLVLFIPVIAISLYTIMDRVMLGMYSNMIELGYYENSSKLTAIPSMAITSLGTVMLPRISNLISQGKRKKAIRYIQKSLIVSLFLSSSMGFGLSAIGKEFVPLFYGKGFEKCIYIIAILVLSSIFISWANVIRTQYLIPNKEDKVYIVSVFLGAFVNIVLNVVLIPQYQAIGAAIGTICAEFSVCAYQTYRVRKKMDIKKYLLQSIPFLIFGIIMYFTLLNIPTIYNSLITLLIKVLVGGAIYIILSASYYIGYLRQRLK